MISDKRDRLVAGYRRRRQAAEIEMVELVRGWHRIYGAYPFIFRTAPALFSLLLLFPSCAAAGEAEELADLKRMTAHPTEPVRKRVMAAGAYCYLGKPASGDEIIRHLEGALAGHALR